MNYVAIYRAYFTVCVSLDFLVNIEIAKFDCHKFWKSYAKFLICIWEWAEFKFSTRSLLKTLYTYNANFYYRYLYTLMGMEHTDSAHIHLLYIVYIHMGYVQFSRFDLLWGETEATWNEKIMCHMYVF